MVPVLLVYSGAMMSTLFLSYARADLDTVALLARDLAANGISVWRSGQPL